MYLVLQNIHKSFGNKKVLKGISLDVKEGQVYGLLGRNGAGKTTTFRIIMNIFLADAGEIWLDGKHIDYENIRIGYLPENSGMYRNRTVHSQLIYFAVLRGLSHKEAKQTISNLLKELDVVEYVNCKYDTLSKGNQQKIKLIVALLHDPQIIILDEPFSGLDPVNASLMQNFIKKLVSKGKIIIFSSHQMNYIEEICDNIGILHDGRLNVTGTIDSIKKQFYQNQVQLNTQNPHKLLECIQSECSSIVSNSTINRNGVIVELIDTNMIRNLQRYLLAKDSFLEGFFLVTPSLNDVFVKVTEAKYQEKGKGMLHDEVF